MAISAGVGPVEGFGDGDTTIAVTLNGTTSGRTIVIGALWFPTSVSLSSVDVGGQAATVHAGSLASSASLDARSQWASLAALSSGGNKTVTATFSGNIGTNEGIIWVKEYAGSDGFDAVNAATGSGTSASLSLTTIADNCHIVAIVQDNFDGTFTAGTGYTITVMTAAAYFNRAEDDTDFDAGTAGAKTVNFTIPNGFWSLSALSIKPTSGGGGAANRIRFPSQVSAMGAGGMLGGNRIN